MSSVQSKSLKHHWRAILLFPLLSFLWLGDVLFTDADLSAFDIVMRLPNWQAEFEYEGVQEMILSDSSQAHYPERQLKWGGMKQGHRVNYNPYIFSGYEDFAFGVGALVSSPFQFWMAVDEAIDWSMWLRLTLAGLFMYVMLLGIGLDGLSAMLGGTIWAFNLHQIVWLEFPQHLATQLWIPLIFYLDYLILSKGVSRLRVAALLITNMFFYTSGYIQIVLYTYVGIGVFNTVYLLTARGLNFKQRSLRWVFVHSVYIFFALFLLPKLLIDSETIQNGLRGTQTSRAGLVGVDFGLSSLLGMFKNMLPSIGDFKRFYSPDYLGGLWGERYRGPANIIEFGAYFGLIPLFLLVLSVFSFLRRKQRAVLLAAIALGAFSFGMIHGDPLIKTLFNLIPFSGFGSYGRFITLSMFVVSLLSAVGMAYFIESDSKAKGWLLGGGIVALAIAPLLLRMFDESIDIGRLHYPFYLLGGLGIIVFLMCRFKLQVFIPALLFIVVIADLFIATYEFNPRMRNARNFPLTSNLQTMVDDKEDYRIAVLTRSPLYPPNILQYYGVASTGGYWTTAPLRYIQFIKSAYGEYHLTANGMLFLFHGNLGVLRGLGVKYIVSDREIDDEHIKLMPKQNTRTFFYEMVAPLERVYCGSNVFVYNDEEDLLNALSGLYQAYDRPIVLYGAERVVPGVLSDQCQTDEIKVNLNNVSFNVNTEKASYLMIPYNYSRHWKATVNGESVSLLRSNHTLMALRIEPGRSQIKIWYQNDISVIFAVAKILLAFIILFLVLTSRAAGISKVPVILSALLLIVISLYEFPLFRNDDIGERSFVQMGSGINSPAATKP